VCRDISPIELPDEPRCTALGVVGVGQDNQDVVALELVLGEILPDLLGHPRILGRSVSERGEQYRVL
jgi:hypothetical protein